MRRLHGWFGRDLAAALLLAIFPVACTPSAAPVLPEVTIVVPVGSAAPTTTAAEAPPEEALPAGLSGLFRLLWLALNRDTLAPQTDLAFRSATETDVLRLVRTALPKPRSLDQKANEARFDYVNAVYEHHFVIFKLGNEEDEYRGKLFNAAFTVYRPHVRVAPRETTVYKAIVEARGRASSVAKFRYSDDEADDDLDLHVWDGPDTVITYRAYHDDGEDQDIMVVNFADAGFYHSHGYWHY